MPRDEQLLALVGEVYDATLDPSLWPGALKKADAFVHGYAAAHSKDGTSDSGTVYYDDGGLDQADLVKLLASSRAHSFNSDPRDYFLDLP